MFKGVGAPVPHVERVNSVIGVRSSVKMPVPLILCVPFLILVFDDFWVRAVCQYFFEKVDVAGVVHWMEFPGGWMTHDHHTALAD